MLRMHVSTNARQAKSYFANALAREDYYAEGREMDGRWFGRGAELLGLCDTVEKHEFHGLCDNKHPQTGDPLTPRTKDNRRVGYDISFSCPKSVSVHQALTDDPAMLQAFQKAVRETMQEMETEMKTRVRGEGADADRTTGNMVWAEYTHFTARPVEGHADPHLHAHCFTFNATYDEAEERWKAGQFGDLKRDARYYEAAFDARLAENLCELGFEIDRSQGGWELQGYTREMCETFSRRTKLINDFAKAKGIENPAYMSELGGKTREHKIAGEDKDTQVSEWASRLTSEQRAAFEAVEAARSSPGGAFNRVAGSDRREAVRGALDHAREHCFERNSVVTEKAFLETALRYGVGRIALEDVRQEHAARVRDDQMISRQFEGRQMVTSREVLAEEHAMVTMAREAKGAFEPLGDVGFEGREGFSDGQKNALSHVLGSRDGVTVVGGKAGTGKTTMMKDAVAGIERDGKKVLTFAPSSDAAHRVLRDKEGFEGAETVARLLLSKQLQEKAAGNVIWIDEAGLLGAKTMRQIFDLANDVGARVVLAGDTGQHGPVERGDALRILQRDAGLKVASIGEIFRQKRLKYRKAVQDLADGRTVEGFEKLERMKSVVEIADQDERLEQIAAAYLGTVLRDGKDALVVAPTHREGEKVTASIRDGLRAVKAIGAREREFFQQKSLSWTEAQKRDSANYTAGQVVQFHGAGGGFRRGDRALVVGVEQGRVIVEKKRNNERVSLPLDRASRFDVFSTGRLALSKGDRIRISRNGQTARCGRERKKHDLSNGAIYEVQGFTKSGDIRISNGWTIPKDYGNIAHGYCTTSHASQGATVDRVFIAQSAESFAASSREQFYVSVSRGREKVTIFTDNRSDLKREVQRSGARVSASEVAGLQAKQRRASRIKDMAMRVNRVVRETVRSRWAALRRAARPRSPGFER